MGALLLLLLIVIALVLLWPVPVMPQRVGAAVLAVRGWLRRYWDSQGG